ncbi:MAG: hypothetical protein J6X00_03860 [Clostridia bacterium]|nr:hypothetical protein [Clostridia bacterium]
MKEKDLLKALKKEVTDVMPNCFDAVNAVAVTPETNKKKEVKENNRVHSLNTKFVVAIAMSLVLVFAVMAAMPFIIWGREGNSSSVQQQEEIDEDTSK